MNIDKQDVLFLQNRVAYLRDEQAYKKLFVYFHPPLFRFACNMVKDEDMAEDMVSDLMMCIWDIGSKLAQIEHLKVYLFTAIKNAALNQLEKNKRKQTSLNNGFGDDIADAANDPERQLLFNEVEKIMEKAIAGLPPKCQMVFRLIKEEGFSYKEVSGIADISQNTIETHMRLALHKIRMALQNYLQGKK